MNIFNLDFNYLHVENIKLIYWYVLLHFQFKNIILHFLT